VGSPQKEGYPVTEKMQTTLSSIIYLSNELLLFTCADLFLCKCRCTPWIKDSVTISRKLTHLSARPKCIFCHTFFRPNAEKTIKVKNPMPQMRHPTCQLTVDGQSTISQLTVGWLTYFRPKHWEGLGTSVLFSKHTLSSDTYL
jgi:hypothetical protein